MQDRLEDYGWNVAKEKKRHLIMCNDLREVLVRCKTKTSRWIPKTMAFVCHLTSPLCPWFIGRKLISTSYRQNDLVHGNLQLQLGWRVSWGGWTYAEFHSLVGFLEQFNQLLKKHAVQLGEEQLKVFHLVKVLISGDNMVTVSNGSLLKLYLISTSKFIGELLA